MWRKRVEPLRGSKRFLDTFPSLGPLGRSGNVCILVMYFYVILQIFLVNAPTERIMNNRHK